VIAVYLLRRPIARALTLAIGVALPVAVAASRLELGVHWPTDVVAGLALGALVALVTSAAAIWVAGLPAARRLRVLATTRH
jgi:membrane-associated phospholipid phosphatase